MALKKKARCEEGDWFVVPLAKGNYGLGLLARITPRRIFLGYFFRPSLMAMPDTSQIQALTHHEAVLITLFNGLKIEQGEWPIFYRPSKWSRENWPVPRFAHVDLLEGLPWVIEYDEKNLLPYKRTLLQDKKNLSGLPEDGILSYAIVEQKLSELPEPNEKNKLLSP